MAQLLSAGSPWMIYLQEFPAAGTAREQIMHLLSYAVLASSTYNTQPWKFRIQSEDHIILMAAPERWLKIADADQRELYLSVGCALENLLIAAEFYGYRYKTTYFPAEDDPYTIASVKLELRREMLEEMLHSRRKGLLKFIPIRHTNTHWYDPFPIPEEEFGELSNCLYPKEKSVALQFLTQPAQKDPIEHLTLEADKIQFSDPKWRKERAKWIGKGVFGETWEKARIRQLATKYLDLGLRKAAADAALIAATPAFGILSSAHYDRISQVQTGQVFQRLYLTGAATGIQMHPITQILQLPDLKQKLAVELGMEDRFLQIIFRLGFAAAEKRPSPRLPLKQVIVN